MLIYLLPAARFGHRYEKLQFAKMVPALPVCTHQRC
jgi:hypothetical protein